MLDVLSHNTEEVIHEMLECGWRVGEAEEHNGGFKEAFMGDKGGFPLVAIFDVDIVIAPTDVKFGKQFGIFELINEVRDKGERVSISNSVFIQISVILVGTEASILFFDKEEWECLGRV